jgi:hypothetical protein
VLDSPPILAAVTVIALLAIGAGAILQVRLQTPLRHRGPVRRVAVPLLLLGLLLPTVAQASPAPLPLRWRSSAIVSGEGEISSGRASREGSSFGENRTSGFRLFLQVDPSGYADSPNLYAGFANDPVNNRDPTGQSTVIDEDGFVISVENDGDLSVYQATLPEGCSTAPALRKLGTDECKALIRRSHLTKVGETLWWDSFLGPDSGLPVGRIYLGEDQTALTYGLVLSALTMTAEEAAVASLPDQSLDIKARLPGHRAFHGFLFHGAYVSLRELGNILAGMNAATHGTTFGDFQRMAGALQTADRDAPDVLPLKRLLEAWRVWRASGGKAYGPPPLFGEIPYQYRASLLGYLLALLEFPEITQLARDTEGLPRLPEPNARKDGRAVEEP